MKATKSLLLSGLIIGLGAGCANTNNTQRGAVAGAATGAVLGGVIGHQSGEAKAGAAIGAAAGGLAGAAVGHRADRDRVEAPPPTSVDNRQIVREPPPMPTSNPREAIPPRPAREAVWIEGHYAYTGNTASPYEWVAGHWEIPPPGANHWVPGSWQRSGDGYVYVRGHWQ
jgi:hypothetical protein